MATARYRGLSMGIGRAQPCFGLDEDTARAFGPKRAIFDQVERHFIALNAPPSMLMIEHYHDPLGHPLEATIWIRLPDEAQVALYPSFEETPADQVPRKATLLIGHNAEFERLFGYGTDED